MKGCPAYGDMTIRGTATGGRGEEEETHNCEPTGDDLRLGGPIYEVVQADLSSDKNRLSTSKN